MNEEMARWLSDNRESYEFYLLHAIFHDLEWRASLLGTPIIPDDFRGEEHALVLAAVLHAVTIHRTTQEPIPAPPSEEFMRTFLESASLEEAADDDILRGAARLVQQLQDPAYKEQHSCIKHYFESWYGGVRAKRAARKLQAVDVPDVHGAVAEIQSALASAAQTAVADDEDEMMQVIHGTSDVIISRRPTGIAGLDLCLNGGTAPGECYLLFGGTGGGKSIAAGQVVWNEADMGGYPLIVSTELSPREYVARIVSAAASIRIPVVQDCANFVQIRQAVSGSTGEMFRLPKVEEVLTKVTERIRIAKIHADDGLESRSVLEREVLKYERTVGHKPTLVVLDWLGSVADVGSGGRSGTSERAMAWEMSANSCVKFAETSEIPTFVLAQAVNDAQLKRVLTIGDIGISKGIGKNMVLAVGVTNAIDKAGIAAAVSGKAEMPRSMILEDQFFCVCKARKGEGSNIPVRRDFLYQRFIEQPRN